MKSSPDLAPAIPESIAATAPDPMHEFLHPIRLLKTVGRVFFVFLGAMGKLAGFIFTSLMHTFTPPYYPLAKSALLKEETP